MLKMFIEILEECRITLKWVTRVTHDVADIAIDTLLSVVLGK